MNSVYILQFVRAISESEEDVKLIGVYRSLQQAEQARWRLSKKPGFCDYRDGFIIDEYEIDRDHWQDGFHPLP